MLGFNFFVIIPFLLAIFITKGNFQLIGVLLLIPFVEPVVLLFLYILYGEGLLKRVTPLSVLARKLGGEYYNNEMQDYNKELSYLLASSTFHIFPRRMFPAVAAGTVGEQGEQFQTGEIITAFGGVFALIGLIATVYGAASHNVVAAYEPKGIRAVSNYQLPVRSTQSTVSAGQPQNGVRHCPNCGAEIPREYSFCNACGQKQ